MSEQQRGGARMLTSVTVGVVIGLVEVVLAISFAGLVFGGYLARFTYAGIGLFLVAAAIALSIMAWRGGARGIVGSLQDATAAVLAIVATTTALAAFGSLQRSFYTVVAATFVVTVLTGVTFFLIGRYRLANMVRFVPYPVVGGFLAGTGWLLFKGGIGVASGVQPSLRTVHNLIEDFARTRWIPAVVFGVLLLVAVRVVKRPLVIPVVIGIALVVFAAWMLVTGSSLDDVRKGFWLIGPFPDRQLLQPWAFRALNGADWSAVLVQGVGIIVAVFVAVLAALSNIDASEIVLHRDLDTNQELRDAGVLNVVSGALGGIPGYHALSLTALAERMSVDARIAGLVAAAVPLAAVVFGASVIELIPRLIVGGVLVFLGLAFIVEWVWDKRKVLPKVEYIVVLVILAGIIAKGFLPGVVIGLVMAVVLFAVNYGRIEQVREVSFGDTYRSNVDRPPAEREALRSMGERVQVLRLNGFVFFGSANGLLERIRKRVESAPLRYLILDLGRVTGMDASAANAFLKVSHLAEASGFELVMAGVADPVRDQLTRVGVVASEGIVRSAPDLDRGLQVCEDALLADPPREVPLGQAIAQHEAIADDLADRLRPYLEQLDLPAGHVLIRQHENPDDVYLLESGSLRIEAELHEGTRIRLRTVLPGVVVGEVALYTGAPRTADVIAEVPSRVMRLSRDALDRIQREDPELAAAMHRWFATVLADRLDDTLREFDALLD